ncbi:MAG: Crp/Fnr family transcriptional regulator [Alphaproteobacteria bacterium]|nr:Crp/Fnr family transcriptional regulator [Alphaproteobacteria bacterium]
MPSTRPTETPNCRSCPLRKNPAFRKFKKSELAFVEKFKAGEVNCAAGENILVDGQSSDTIYTIKEGWCVRIKYLAHGERQVLNASMPGDLVGLQPSLFGVMQHSVYALTDATLCSFPRKQLSDLFTGFPDLALDVTWLAAKEEVMLADHLVNVGQRSALVRMAYLFAHFFDRGERAKLVTEGSLEFPFTQELLADALGLSLVHTNKTLRKLKATKCVNFHRGRLEITDLEMLHELADFEPFNAQPRPFI